MLVFSEYQTDTIDLALDFYGYEDCPKTMNLALASEIILSCILLQKERESSTSIKKKST